MPMRLMRIYFVMLALSSPALAKDTSHVADLDRMALELDPLFAAIAVDSLK